MARTASGSVARWMANTACSASRPRSRMAVISGVRRLLAGVAVDNGSQPLQGVLRHKLQGCDQCVRQGVLAGARALRRESTQGGADGLARHLNVLEEVGDNHIRSDILMCVVPAVIVR